MVATSHQFLAVLEGGHQKQWPGTCWMMIQQESAMGIHVYFWCHEVALVLLSPAILWTHFETWVWLSVIYVYIYIFIYSLAMQNYKHKYTCINAVWLHIRTCISPFFSQYFTTCIHLEGQPKPPYQNTGGRNAEGMKVDQVRQNSSLMELFQQQVSPVLAD